MSYESTSELNGGTSIKRLKEVIELLGYKSAADWPDSGRLGSYYWYEHAEYKSWTGVELSIYRTDEKLLVNTRSRSSRSYWDLKHQNRTLKLIRDIFGGHFTTDVGRNKYGRPETPPPSPLSSGCYLARWRFHNALGQAQFYLMSRNLEGDAARNGPSGFSFLDEMNPRLLSNNLLVPFIIAAWEEYFRATFAAVLRYADKREAVLKKAHLRHAQLEQIAAGRQQAERAIAECFSFQRPSMIGENFRLVDAKLDISAAMRKPYRSRKINLYQSIEALVEGRNTFVHEGEMDMSLYDKKLDTTLKDIVVAVDRSYEAIGKHFGFIPIREY